MARVEYMRRVDAEASSRGLAFREGRVREMPV
jgi:hypothetical protein